MNWKRACALSDLEDNSMKPMTVGGIDLLVIRSGDTVRAIPPSCPHMRTALAEGFFDGCVLTCIKHLWQWTVDDGKPMGQAEAPLLKYETRQEDGQVYVNVETELRYEHQCEAET